MLKAIPAGDDVLESSGLKSMSDACPKDRAAFTQPANCNCEPVLSLKEEEVFGVTADLPKIGKYKESIDRSEGG